MSSLLTPLHLSTIMSTQVAVPDPIDSITHKSMSMSFMHPIDPITSQSLHHPLGAPRHPQLFRPDDSAAQSSFLEGLPHVRTKLDAK
jgi:hypothetical protein